MKIILLIITYSFFIQICFCQKADTAAAFATLEKYAYGVPLKKNFASWEHKIKTDDNFTYSNSQYKKFGIVLSNIIDINQYKTFGKLVDSAFFVIQNTTELNKQTNEKEQIHNLQLYIIFKKATLKTKVDSIFKYLENEMLLAFDEENINKNKFNNGTKTMYALHPNDSKYPITVQKYFDENEKRFVIDIFITKRKNYYTIVATDNN